MSQASPTVQAMQEKSIPGDGSRDNVFAALTALMAPEPREPGRAHARPDAAPEPAAAGPGRRAPPHRYQPHAAVNGRVHQGGTLRHPPGRAGPDVHGRTHLKSWVRRRGWWCSSCFRRGIIVMVKPSL